MRNFKRKKSWRDIIQSKPFLILFGILILFFAWNVLGFWNKMQDTAKNEKIAEEKISDLQQQKDQLSSDINSLNTDEGKEKVFREDFGLAKDGEDMIVVVDDKNTPPPTPVAQTGFFAWIKNLFK